MTQEHITDVTDLMMAIICNANKEYDRYYSFHNDIQEAESGEADSVSFALNFLMQTIPKGKIIVGKPFRDYMESKWFFKYSPLKDYVHMFVDHAI